MYAVMYAVRPIQRASRSLLFGEILDGDRLSTIHLLG